MAGDERYDAIVVGAGPNGLAAAATLGAAGQRVLVVEAAPRPGGGCRSEALIRPGYVHDLCAAVHPLGASSPAFRALDLEAQGLEWVHPDVLLAHPLDDGPAPVLVRDADVTADGLGVDADRWRANVGAFATSWDAWSADILRPLVHVPRHPVALARFAARGTLPARVLARSFRTPAARAIFAGNAAHAMLPLDRPLTAAFGIMLASSAHVHGWPFARGGSQAIVDALVKVLHAQGVEIETDHHVTDLGTLPPARAVLLDLPPARVLPLAGDRLPGWYRRLLATYRRGPGAFKVDYVLSEPVPWRDERCRAAGTVHVGGTIEEVHAALAAVHRGAHPARPFVLVSQPTVCDPTRAPEGGHVLWAYCHVPNGSTFDMTERIEAQIERFAPGFRDVVEDRATITAAQYEVHDPAYAGGDISGGAHSLRQMVARPVPFPDPYRTPAPGLYLCGSSTPPGAGVHGMCGWFAAQSALRHSLAR